MSAKIINFPKKFKDPNIKLPKKFKLSLFIEEHATEEGKHFSIEYEFSHKKLEENESLRYEACMAILQVLLTEIDEEEVLTYIINNLNEEEYDDDDWD